MAFPIAAAIGLAAEFAPSLLGMLFGDKAEKAAETVTEVARRVTGAEDADAVVAALKADPDMALRFRQQTDAAALAIYQEDTKRLAEVNATMRAEAGSQDAYVRRWRPTMGYAVTFAFVTIVLAGAYAIYQRPEDAASVIGALMAIIAMALGVLGVAVRERSKDKQVAAGITPTGIVDLLKR